MKLLSETLLLLTLSSLLAIDPNNTSNYQKSKEYYEWKVGSTFPFGSFNADSFQYRLFNSLYFQESIDANSTLKIPRGNPAVYYNDRNYYWGLENSRINQTSETSLICEYVITSDDQKLEEIEFVNGTRVSSLFFECSQAKTKCCGMYCCQTGFHVPPVGTIIIFLFIVCSLFGCFGCVITWCCSKCSVNVCCCCPNEAEKQRKQYEECGSSDVTADYCNRNGDLFEDSDHGCNPCSCCDC